MGTLMPNKTIIFCADGTWNSAMDATDSKSENSNVYKLFCCLPGFPEGLMQDQEKNYTNHAEIIQCAKYIDGVGNGNTQLEKYAEGAVGVGVIARIVRGYTYVSRLYVEGDRIVLTGFSRGAYTVRALAGLIATKGLLPNVPTLSADEAHRCGTKIWFEHFLAGKPDKLAEIAAIGANFKDYITSINADTTKQRAVKSILAVAVWDTVGALGIPDLTGIGPVDAFRFANNALNEKVEYGLHAISKHEQRATFQPFPWAKRDRIQQLLFAGAHADVGGGYVAEDSQLSDVALAWMIEELSKIGVVFDQAKVASIKGNIGGKIHQPWNDSPWNKDLNNRPRVLDGIDSHPSLIARQHANFTPW